MKPKTIYFVQFNREHHLAFPGLRTEDPVEALEYHRSHQGTSIYRLHLSDAVSRRNPAVNADWTELTAEELEGEIQ